MKGFAVALVLVGTLFALAGLVFAFQGMGLVGPGSSFMYNNSSWITYGQGLIVVGILAFAGGLWLNRSRAAPSVIQRDQSG